MIGMSLWHWAVVLVVVGLFLGYLKIKSLINDFKNHKLQVDDNVSSSELALNLKPTNLNL